MSRERIDEAHLAFLDAMKANDAHALGQLVTADAVLMPPNEHPVIRRASLAEWFDGVVKQARTIGVDVGYREVMVAGDYGIERGSFVWKLSPAAGGTPFESRGSWMAIYQREPDGNWKIT